MPQIYDKPVWRLMRDMVDELRLRRGDLLSRDRVEAWFAEKYPKIKKGTISAHLLRMSTNAPSRIYYHGKPADDDLLFQVDSGHFRLYDPERDPLPIYDAPKQVREPEEGRVDDDPSSAQFAYERDLRSFLSKNLSLLEPGLALYDDEGLIGIEFPAGGRFIDLLAVDARQGLVVIELKVSRGYDRTVGQLLRYVGWVAENLAEPDLPVRGMIVAREISEDLFLACRGIPNIELYEYELSVAVRRARRTGDLT
jgi:hypothetical protein